MSTHDLPMLQPSHHDFVNRFVYVMNNGRLDIMRAGDFMPCIVKRRTPSYQTGSCVGSSVPKKAKRLKRRRAKELCELIKLRSFDWSKCNCIHQHRGKGLR